MRLLITRPEHDAKPLAALLEKRGHVAVIAPLMEVRFHSGPAPDLKTLQAVIATSANGIRAFAARTKERALQVFAVGPQTAEAAKAEGFSTIKSADGDASELVTKIEAWADPAKGALYHAAGAETAGKIAQALHAKGFTVTSDILYDAVAVTELPETAAHALKTSALDGVLLFSPRSAKIFATLVSTAGLSDACKRLDAYCISAATASAAAPIAFARVAVASTPNQDAMLELLAS